MVDERKKTYAESMNEWADEKRFLRKVRHRLFHPDNERPLAVRLIGYVGRLVIIALVVLVILFFRNRSYFNGESFRDAVKAEADQYFGVDDSTMPPFSWKGPLAVTDYSAREGFFFKELKANRVTAEMSWRELLFEENWTLRNVGISEVDVVLRPSAPYVPGDKAPLVREKGFLQASPDFSKIDFGMVTLYQLGIQWGSDWSSEGSLKGASGRLQQDDGRWKLEVSNGLLSQNWLKDLKLVPGGDPPLEVFVQDHTVHIRNGVISFGDKGTGTIDGTVALGLDPLLDVNVRLQDANFEDFVPDDFFEFLSGRGNFDLKVGGSTNRTEGVTVDGTFTVSDIQDDSGLFAVGATRLRDFPILRTLSVISARPELRRIPINAGSFDFSTKRGVLTVSRIALRSSDIAQIRGAFRYESDTRHLEKVIFEGLDAELVQEPSPTLGFSGEIEIGIRSDLLKSYPTLKKQHFVEEDGFSWIKVPLNGPLLGLTAEQARILDHESKQKE